MASTAVVENASGSAESPWILVVCACAEEARFVRDALEGLVVGESSAPLRRPLARGRRWALGAQCRGPVEPRS